MASMSHVSLSRNSLMDFASVIVNGAPIKLIYLHLVRHDSTGTAVTASNFLLIPVEVVQWFMKRHKLEQLSDLLEWLK